MYLFVPNLLTIDPEKLISIGLENCVDDAVYLPGVSLSDDVAEGTLIGWRSWQGQPDLSPELVDRLKWTPAVANNNRPADRYFLGWDPDGGPGGPETLARTSHVPGPKIELGDGCKWELPAVQNIKQTMIRGLSGDWEFEPERRVRWLSIEADAWRSVFHAVEDVASIDIGDVADFVDRCLRINYRLTPEVINARRLFQTGQHSPVFRAAIAVAFPEMLDGNELRDEFATVAQSSVT